MQTFLFSRLRGSAVITARCAQDAKHAKKDIVTAGYRRS